MTGEVKMIERLKHVSYISSPLGRKDFLVGEEVFKIRDWQDKVRGWQDQTSDEG